MKRSHNCNQLRKDNAGSSSTLIGWIDSLRDHGGVFFLDLRDREGKTQVVLDPENQTLSELFPKLKPESVIEVSGEVRNRDQGTENANLDTGDIELFATSIIVHNQSKTPPFPPTIHRQSWRRLTPNLPLPRSQKESNLNALKLRRGHLEYASILTIRTFLRSDPHAKGTPEGAREFWF